MNMDSPRLAESRGDPFAYSSAILFRNSELSCHQSINKNRSKPIPTGPFDFKSLEYVRIQRDGYILVFSHCYHYNHIINYVALYNIFLSWLNDFTRGVLHHFPANDTLHLENHWLFGEPNQLIAPSFLDAARLHYTACMWRIIGRSWYQNQ